MKFLIQLRYYFKYFAVLQQLTAVSEMYYNFRWEIEVEELEEEGDSSNSNSNKPDEADTDIPQKDVRALPRFLFSN